MNKTKYLLDSYKNNFHLDARWYTELFSIQDKDVDYVYIKVVNGVKYVKINNELVETGTEKTLPILDIFDAIKLPANCIPNLKEDIYTSIGRFIANVLFLVYPLQDRIPYINRTFKHKDIEAIIYKGLKDRTITIPEYRKYVDGVSFSLNLNKLFCYSNTRKSVTPAPGLAKLKLELTDKYNKEYGPKWKEDDARALQFIDELKKFDLEYIKDDPTYGKVMSGKLVNDSRPRMYMAFGVEGGFGDTEKETKFIFNSLSEGYSKNKEELATVFNSARKSSNDRGGETQQAGAMVKDMQSASNSLKIKEGDCNSTYGIPIFVNERSIERYKDVYVIENKKSIFKETINEYLGKTIVIRSTKECRYVDCFCEVCAGKDLAEYKNGISLLVISSAGIVLNAKMKAMHRATRNTMKFNIINTIR